MLQRLRVLLDAVDVNLTVHNYLTQEEATTVGHYLRVAEGSTTVSLLDALLLRGIWTV